MPHESGNSTTGLSKWSSTRRCFLLLLVISLIILVMCITWDLPYLRTLELVRTLPSRNQISIQSLYNGVQSEALDGDSSSYPLRNASKRYHLPSLVNSSEKPVVKINHLGNTSSVVVKSEKLNISANHYSNMLTVDGSVDQEVKVLGEAGKATEFAIFSSTTPFASLSSYSYAFCLPLTALAWKRIGFQSIVVIIGTEREWDSVPALKHILSFLLSLDAIVIFMNTKPDQYVMMSQVSRFFVMNIIPFQNPEKTYLIMSDADLWPLDDVIFHLRDNKKILSLNWDCCGYFKLKGLNYRMLPVGHIGMSAATWKEVVNVYGSEPNTAEDIISYFAKTFPSIAVQPVSKGENEGWFMDQRLISVRIHHWASAHKSDVIDWVSRSGGDRIDRSYGWLASTRTIAGKIDAHLLVDGYLPGAWAQIKPLLIMMYGASSLQYDWCLEYQKTFMQLTSEAHLRGALR